MIVKQTHHGRRAATAVEMAIVSPILFLFIFASVEFSRANMMRHTCGIAAAQGARQGIIPGANAKKCLEAALAELAIIGVTGAEVAISPSRIRESDAEVTVTVTAPMARNGYIFSRFLLGKSVTASVTLQRETTTFN